MSGKRWCEHVLNHPPFFYIFELFLYSRRNFEYFSFSSNFIFGKDNVGVFPNGRHGLGGKCEHNIPISADKVYGSKNKKVFFHII